MPLGTEVGLGPGDIVLDGTQLPKRGTAAPPLFGHVAKRSPISTTAELLVIIITINQNNSLVEFHMHMLHQGHKAVHTERAAEWC